MSGSAQPAAGDFTPPAESNGITDFINNSSNIGKEIAQTIASETLSRGIARGAGGLRGAAGGLAGALVQPAVWVLGGRAPQPGDIELWGLGTAVSLAGGAIGSVATIATGVVKALVEDHEDGIIAQAVAQEPATYRPFIRSVRNYGMSGRGIVAMTIANHGGVTWRVGPATWVYITDATGKLVCDYRPAHAIEIYGPDLPLRVVDRRAGQIRYRWSARNGNIHG
jgi:hypothetical protein